MSAFHSLIRRLSLVVTLGLLACSQGARGAVPALLNHQGSMAVNGVKFEGTGFFKFALVDGAGTTTYWSNDATSVAGSQPTAAVSIPVVKGLYAVLLGDTTLTNMASLPVSVFDNTDVRLRVWFNDGATGFQVITPDQRLAAAPYALVAASVNQALLNSIVAPPAKPVVAWGRNRENEATVPALSNVAAVAAGATYSLALLKSGTVVQWGTGTAVPAGLNSVTQISARVGFSLARRSNGTIFAWGDNTYGQTTLPVGISDATAVAAGEKHGIVLHANGTVTGWGDDSFNQTDVPGGLGNVTAIAAGYDHNLALKADGTVVAWGRNDSNQSDVPVGLNNVIFIAAGAYHSLAVKSDGSVVAWGWNSGGQSTIPSGLSGVTKVAGGYSFSLALKTDGTVVAWGDPTDGALTVPTGATQVTSIVAGATHALALRADLVPAQLARLDQDSVFTANVGIKRTPAVNALEVEGSVSKTTAGSWLANSDRRIKTEVRTVDHALQTLDKVRLVDFRYSDDYRAAHPGVADKRYVNVIAQEFATVFPEDVKSSGEKLPDGSEILQVDTYPLTIYSAAAVQELHRENTALKAKLADQEERLRRLEAALQKH